MSYKVLIRNNLIGETRERTMDLRWDSSSEYWWTEGNFGCDCNREMEFKRAGGEDPGDPRCGHGKYSAVKAILPTGEEIMLDEDNE